MSFSTEIVKSVNDFRVLVQIDSKDTLYSGKFSFNAFNPIGSVPYEGRLVSAPKISINRDSNQFGILVYSSSSFTLNNTDGYFDDLLVNYNVIGATVRIYIGYNNLNISEYVNIYTGFVESININENVASFSISDLRKRLKTGNSTDISFVNAVQGIENILLGNYTITAGSTYFDVSAMTAAKSLAYTVVRTHPDNDTVDAAIEDCVKSTMGFFFITGDGRYSYKMIDTSVTSVSTISHYDIINPTSVAYDSSNILASVSVENSDYVFEQRYNSTTTYSNLYTTYYGNKIDNAWIYSGYITNGASICVIRSLDNGYTWNNSIVIPSDASETKITVITKAPSIATGGCVIGTYENSNIYYSNDAGSSWSFIKTIATGYCCYGFQLAGSSNLPIVAITNNTSFTGAIFRGASTLSSVYTQVYGFPSISSGTSIFALDSYGTSGSIIAGGGGGLSTSKAFVIKSSDSGSSWSSIINVSSTSSTYIGVGGLKYIDSTHLLAVCSDNNLYMSNDSGSTWSVVLTIAGKYIDKLVISKNKCIYLSTRNYGVDDPYNMYVSYPNSSGIAGSAWTTYKIIKNYNTSNLYNTNLISDIDTGDIIFLLGTGGTTGFGVHYASINSGKSNALNNSYKASTYSQYGIDTLKHFPTVLAYYSDAILLGDDLINYFKDLHGMFSITVPMKYYTVNLGDNVDVEIWRETTQFLGTKKCEVMGKSYDLESAFINFDLRII